MFEKMMPGKKYPFLVSNTDRSDQGRMHWWSIMNISPKKELFFFDLYEIEGMKHFIVSDDKKNSRKNIKRDRNNRSERQKGATLQAKIFNECLREANRKRNQKTFGKYSRLFSFNT